METIICTLCNKEKPVAEFYKNKGMPSGYANQCKECVKTRSKIREIILRKDPTWVEKEKIRAREKYNRLNYKEKQKEWDNDKPWKKTNIYKGLSKKLKNKGLIKANESIHHWNYNLLEDIFILPNKLHRKLHTKLDFDKNTLCFIAKSGEILDTRKKHEEFIKLIKNQ